MSLMDAAREEVAMISSQRELIDRWSSRALSFNARIRFDSFHTKSLRCWQYLYALLVFLMMWTYMVLTRSRTSSFLGFRMKTRLNRVIELGFSSTVSAVVFAAAWVVASLASGKNSLSGAPEPVAVPSVALP